MKRFLLILLPASLIGCAGTPPEQEVNASEPGVHCERDQATGSRMITTRCRTAAQREQDKRDVDAMNEASRRMRNTRQ
ncbi:MAG: hypothetical protein EOP35_15675 [Rubrivivax sp.]|nr:MAG: hypothetical protein EOP35_15675 [Rubrivivax sp.]